MDVKSFIQGNNFNPRRFASSVKYGSLGDSHQNISKVMKRFSGDIKRGQFSRVKDRAWSQIMSSQKDLNWEGKRDLKKIFNHLSSIKPEVNKAKEIRLKRIEEAQAEKKEMEKLRLQKLEEKKPVKEKLKPYQAPRAMRINRDPGSEYDFNEFRANIRSGVGDRRIKPIQTSKPSLNNTGVAISRPANPFRSLK